jgi:hypothetical protein
VLYPFVYRLFVVALLAGEAAMGGGKWSCMQRVLQFLNVDKCMPEGRELLQGAEATRRDSGSALPRATVDGQIVNQAS